MLYINPIGGIANRMRALASGIALANDLNVDFKIIWLRNWELNARFEDIFQTCPLVSGRINYPGKFKYGVYYSIPRLKNLYISKLSLKRFGVYLSSEDAAGREIFRNDDSDSAVRKMFLNGLKDKRDCLIQGGTNMYPFSDDLYSSLFQPNNIIKERLAQQMAILGEECYGVHIRRTDNLQSIANSPDYLFIDEIKNILGKNPDAKFYLATDSEEVKKNFKLIFGDKIFYSASAADRNSVQGIHDAAVELFTLSKTKYILGSFYSSFSEAAAKLGNITLKQLSIKQ